MEIKTATATLFLDKRIAKSTKKYPLKLTIYYNLNKKRYATGIDLSDDDWKKINSDRLKDKSLKDIKLETSSILSKAQKIIDEVKPFSFSAFENAFFEKNNNSEKINLSLKHWFKEYQDILEAEGREGTRGTYNTTFNSLELFRPGLLIHDISKELLQAYEQHMVRKGKSSSTIGIYLRNLRAIINRAIEAKVLSQDNYPFKGYEIPSSRNVKKTLNDNQIQMLLSYVPTNQEQQYAWDFWIFSYLCSGMNFTDIAHLRKSDINGSFLSFFRRKTIRTKKKDLRPIKVPLHTTAIEIIKRRRTNNAESEYLFPILDHGLSTKQIKYRIQSFIKKVNTTMGEIRINLGFEGKLGTYVARHSFSSKLMRSGAPTQFIKDSLGHSSILTTESYLGDFEDSVKTEYSNMLTTFKE